MRDCNSQETHNYGFVTLNTKILRGAGVTVYKTLFEILKNQCEPEISDGALSEFQKLQVVTQMY